MKPKPQSDTPLPQPSNVDDSLSKFDKIMLSYIKSCRTDFIMMNNEVKRLKELTELDIKTPEDLIQYSKKIQTFRLLHRDGLDKCAPLITKDPYDTALLFGGQCSGVLCTKSVVMVKSEAVRRIAFLLGSEIISSNASPSEFDAMLDTIPAEKLLEALKALAKSFNKDPDIIEIHIKIAGGPHN